MRAREKHPEEGRGDGRAMRRSHVKMDSGQGEPRATYREHSSGCGGRGPHQQMEIPGRGMRAKRQMYQWLAGA